MGTRRAAEVFPPGEFLKDELEVRGWTQTDLAEIVGRPVSTFNDIINGRRGVSAETARGLAAAFGTSAEYWMNLDASYQLSRVRETDDATIARRAKLYEKAPVKEMMRRGWIEPSENIAVLEDRVVKFFGINHIDDDPDVVPHAARKSTPYDRPLTIAQQAWLRRAMQLTPAVHAEPFSEQRFKEAINKLRLLVHVPQEARHVPRILSDAGVRFVIVQPLPGNRIDGACFWIDNAPTIAMSLRFDRIDNFWYVLFHELGHVSKGEASLDIDLESADLEEDRLQMEHEADAFATETLLPAQQLESFISRVGPFYSAARIEAFAQTMDVHPAIVIGQLQHRKEIAYSSFRKKLVPIREWVIAAALTDGWETTLPAEL